MGEANCLVSLGDLRLRTDDLAGAQEAYEAALPIYRAIDARMGEANCLQEPGGPAALAAPMMLAGAQEDFRSLKQAFARIYNAPSGYSPLWAYGERAL